MGELLPFLFGATAGVTLGRWRVRPTAAAALVLALGAAASAINGEIVNVYAPVFVLIDAALALLGYTAAPILVRRVRRMARN
jgi:hypothetical protein